MPLKWHFKTCSVNILGFFFCRINHTYFLSTAISFSMLVSFPLSAFLGMHLIATIFPVAFSRAITTSENAPLQKTEKNTLVCCFTCTQTILTQKTYCQWVDGGHSATHRARVHKQHIVDIYWERTENRTMNRGLPCCCQKHGPLKKLHPLKTT